MLAAMREFYLAKTSFDVRKVASVLITRGPYRFSRNPAYACLTVLYVALAVLRNNAWILVLVLPTLWIMNGWVIPREERYLEARFGDAYRAYKARVRRWL